MRKFDALDPGLGNWELKHHLVFVGGLWSYEGWSESGQLSRHSLPLLSLIPPMLQSSDTVTWTNVFPKKLSWMATNDSYQSFKFNNSFFGKFNVEYLSVEDQRKKMDFDGMLPFVSTMLLTVAHFQQGKAKASGDPTTKSLNCVPVR